MRHRAAFLPRNIISSRASSPPNEQRTSEPAMPMFTRTPMTGQTKRTGAGKQPKRQQYVSAHSRGALAQGGAYKDIEPLLAESVRAQVEREAEEIRQQGGEVPDEVMEANAMVLQESYDRDMRDRERKEGKETKYPPRRYVKQDVTDTYVDMFRKALASDPGRRPALPPLSIPMEKTILSAETSTGEKKGLTSFGTVTTLAAPKTKDLIASLLTGQKAGKARLSGPLGRMQSEREVEKLAQRVEDQLYDRTRMRQETTRDIDQIPGYEDLVDLPESAQRWLTKAPERWSEVFGQNPHWMQKILKDLHNAYRFPPRGASTGYLSSVIRDITAMLDKEAGRMMSSSHSRLRSRALLKEVRSRPNNPIPRYDDTLDYVPTDYVRGVARVAPGHETYEAGPNVQQTYAMPHGDSLIGKGQPLHVPHTEYATPEQRLLQKEAIHAVVGLKPRKTGYQYRAGKSRSYTHQRMGKTAGRRLGAY